MKGMREVWRCRGSCGYNTHHNIGIHTAYTGRKYRPKIEQLYSVALSLFSTTLGYGAFERFDHCKQTASAEALS
jgi:hypothetical protein